MCKLLLHGPRNYVNQTWKQWANYSAQTFSCYCTKLKCNFSLSSVRWIQIVRTIVTDCVGLFFLEKKRKWIIVGEFTKMFETVVGIELLEGNVGTCRYSIFLVKLHGEHLPEFFISSQWLGPSIQPGSHLHNQLWLPVTWGTPPGIIEQTQSICSIYSFNRNIIALKNESMYNSFKPNQLQMITRYKCQSSVQINPGIMPKMYWISHSR